MRTFALGACALALLGACSQTAPAPTREEIVARGEYIVATSGCHDCHTPMTAQGPDMTHALQGATLFFQAVHPEQFPTWAPTSPRIAGLPVGYTEEQVAALMQGGARPDGSHPNPPMPPMRFNEADAQAIAAYLASLEAQEPAPAPTTTP